MKFETDSGSIYEIDPILKRYRKAGEPWKDCLRGLPIAEGVNPEASFTAPVERARYLIVISEGKDLLTNFVKKVL